MIILFILVWALCAGWIANIVTGGSSRPDDWVPLLVAGFAGSFVGGILGSLIAHEGLKLRPSGLLGTIIGSIIVLGIWKLVKKD